MMPTSKMMAVKIFVMLDPASRPSDRRMNGVENAHVR